MTSPPERGSGGGRPDLVVLGRIATLVGDAGPGWATGIVIRDGRVVAAGSAEDMARLARPGTRRLTLGVDEVALPGLTDAHLHLVEAALARQRIDLGGAATLETALDAIAAAARARPDPLAWLEGAGWDADRLGRWPTAEDLERVAPGRLVALWAHDHHALWVSARALALTGIGRDRPDPDGGVIRRGQAGEPTGILHETAARLVAGLVPPPDETSIAAALERLMPELLALGVVAVHDPGGVALQHGLGGSLGAYRSLAAHGRLALRVHASVRPEQLGAATEAGLRSGEALGPDPRDRLRMGWLKTFADGTLGSRTAALLEPLGSIPGEPPPPNDGYGVWLTPPDELREQAARAASAGIATQVHAIGDAAVRAALDALAPTVGATPLMPRVEHAQLVATSDIARFAELGIAVSMQPIHVRSDAAKARGLWGERGEALGYPLAAIAATGAVLPVGTDAPVEPVDPWPGLACAVTRAAPSWSEGTLPFGAANALTLWRAIRAACIDGPASAGEHDRGRLVPGQRADLLVLPARVMAEPVEVGGALWQARPRLVVLDGEIVAGG